MVGQHENSDGRWFLGPKLIGFLGLRGSGKSEAAIYLSERWGYKRTRIAQPLKDMLAALGLSEAEIDGELKEAPCDLLCGKSPRHAMQTLGTEWGRVAIGEDFWLNAWRRLMDDHEFCVVDDTRFPNEVKEIKARGGLLVRIDRPGTVRDAHVSENALGAFEPDFVIDNSGDLAAFHKAIDGFILSRLPPEERVR